MSTIRTAEDLEKAVRSGARYERIQNSHIVTAACELVDGVAYPFDEAHKRLSAAVLELRLALRSGFADYK